MHRTVTQRTLLGVLGTALLSGGVFAAGPFLDELPTVVISDQMTRAEVEANPLTPYDPFTAPTRNIYRFTDAFVPADYITFEGDMASVRYIFQELTDTGSELVPVAAGAQTITINGAPGNQSITGIKDDFNFGTDPSVTNALTFVDVFYTGPDPNNPTNPQGLSEVEGETPFLKRSYISMWVGAQTGLDVGQSTFEVITTNTPVYDPEADAFVRYDFATTGPVDTGFLQCELVLDELSNWSLTSFFYNYDINVNPINPTFVYSSPPAPPTVLPGLVGGFTPAGTTAIGVSVDGTAPGTVVPGLPGFEEFFSPQIALLDSYGLGNLSSLAGAPSFANALPGTQVVKDRVYMARTTVANTAQSGTDPGRLPALRFRLGETAIAGLGLAIDQINDLSPNNIAVGTTRVHRSYFYALADGTGASFGPDIADRNLTFGFDVVDTLGSVFTDDVTFELRKVEILSFELANLGAGDTVLNVGGQVGSDFTLASGVAAPPADPAPFGFEWVYASTIDALPFASERVTVGTRGASDEFLSIDYSAGLGNTIASWDTRGTFDAELPEILNGIPNDSIVVAEFYLSTTHDPATANPAETRIALTDAAAGGEGRGSEFRFRPSLADVDDGQTVDGVGRAPGSVTGLEAAAKRYVVIIEPQSQVNTEVGLRLGAVINLIDALTFPDLSQDPPVVVEIGGEPFVFAQNQNGNLTINRVVVTVYPRPQDLIDFECP